VRPAKSENAKQAKARAKHAKNDEPGSLRSFTSKKRWSRMQSELHRPRLLAAVGAAKLKSFESA
jgi:hypothetical protein